MNKVHATWYVPCKTGLMLHWLGLLSDFLVRFSRSRHDLLLENLALRQQLAALKRSHPQPRIPVSDKLFWVVLRRSWPRWKQALIFVQPETVVRWHRAGFKLYWAWLSRHRARAGRKCVAKELRELVFRMVAEKSYLGRTPHSWRTQDSRLRYLRASRIALDAESTTEP